jgi:hypothetical protein
MLNLFWAVQACFLAILVACGPLAIAASLAPGAGDVFRRWLSAFVEVAVWPIFAAIILEMLAVGADRIINAKGDGDWFALLVLCTVLVLMIACVPTIASRLVGQGFGAVGPMLMSAAHTPLGVGGRLLKQLDPRPFGGGATVASAVAVVRVAPHWGQRDTIFEYYRRRSGPEEPFVAYQMNWKGENFYTGNHVPAFVASGAKFKSWLAEQREEGTRVVYFTTEHSRESSLKTDLGKVTRFERLTTKTLNNKFFLARVEL